MAFLLLWCEGDSGKEKELGDGYILVAFQLVKSLDYTKGLKTKTNQNKYWIANLWILILDNRLDSEFIYIIYLFSCIIIIFWCYSLCIIN